MHKININLHNRFDFSVWKYRETIRLDMVYVCAKLHNFSGLPGCEMGSKDPAFLGLK